LDVVSFALLFGFATLAWILSVLSKFPEQGVFFALPAAIAYFSLAFLTFKIDYVSAGSIVSFENWWLTYFYLGMGLVSMLLFAFHALTLVRKGEEEGGV